MGAVKTTQLPAANPTNIDDTVLVPVVDTLGASVKASVGQLITGAGMLTSLTGDVTTVGNVATIADDAVDGDKIADAGVGRDKLEHMSAERLMGRGDSGTGEVESITLASTLQMVGTQLGVTPGGTAFHGLIMHRAFGGL